MSANPKPTQSVPEPLPAASRPVTDGEVGQTIAETLPATGFPVDGDKLRLIIAATARCKARQRGFEPGHEAYDRVGSERGILSRPVDFNVNDAGIQ
jgi:hypothetical protein